MWGAIMRLLRSGPDPRIEAKLEAERILQQAGEQADREARKRQEEAREQAQAERDQISPTCAGRETTCSEPLTGSTGAKRRWMTASARLTSAIPS